MIENLDKISSDIGRGYSRENMWLCDFSVKYVVTCFGIRELAVFWSNLIDAWKYIPVNHRDMLLVKMKV